MGDQIKVSILKKLVGKTLTINPDSSSNSESLFFRVENIFEDEKKISIKFKDGQKRDYEIDVFYQLLASGKIISTSRRIKFKDKENVKKLDRKKFIAKEKQNSIEFKRGDVYEYISVSRSSFRFSIADFLPNTNSIIVFVLSTRLHKEWSIEYLNTEIQKGSIVFTGESMDEKMYQDLIEAKKRSLESIKIDESIVKIYKVKKEVKVRKLARIWISDGPSKSNLNIWSDWNSIAKTDIKDDKD
jgi:hypothetical protein